MTQWLWLLSLIWLTYMLCINNQPPTSPPPPTICVNKTIVSFVCPPNADVVDIPLYESDHLNWELVSPLCTTPGYSCQNGGTCLEGFCYCPSPFLGRYCRDTKYSSFANKHGVWW
jgi:hypothetical protein